MQRKKFLRSVASVHSASPVNYSLPANNCAIAACTCDIENEERRIEISSLSIRLFEKCCFSSPPTVDNMRVIKENIRSVRVIVFSRAEHILV